jgi:hypothetical protein
MESQASHVRLRSDSQAKGREPKVDGDFSRVSRSNALNKQISAALDRCGFDNVE